MFAPWRASVLLGKRAVTADTDLRLARYFGVSEGFFLGLQADFDLMERRREIAILMAMGSTRAAIVRIFMSQGAFTGLLGALVGTTIGLSGAFSLANLGLPLNPEVYYISAIPVDVRLTDVLAINAVALLVSLLSTVYPAIQAARLRPVEGLNAA